jgi:predicted TIM-barrel fold metal-dependent hydrolase
VPQPQGSVVIPPNTTVVSVDSHWSVTGDIFYKRFPDHLKDRAPRILPANEDGFHAFIVDGKPLIPPLLSRVIGSYERVEGCVSMEARLKDFDRLGIDKEIVFGNSIGAFHAWPDLEVREWVYRIYNEYLAELAEQAPGRFYGVGMVNYWDPSQARASVAELTRLGLKTLVLPITPRGANFVELDYADPIYDPLFAAIEEAGLPICFHVGEFAKDGPGAMGISQMINFAPLRKNMAEMIFGGIFDRHPDLKVVFVEADLNWIPGALQTAEITYDCFTEFLDPKINLRPSEYWHRNCYATFINDPTGLAMVNEIGTDRVMWSSDYPHQESSLGYEWSTIGAVVDAVSEAEARMMLGGTALEVFKLN